MAASCGMGPRQSEAQLLRKVLTLMEEDDSPMLQRIEKWCFSVCDQFKGIKSRASSVDPITEYPLQCRETHTNYVKLVEVELEQFLTLEETTVPEFLDILARRDDLADLTDNLIRCLEALTDFDVFVAMMEDAEQGALLRT